MKSFSSRFRSTLVAAAVSGILALGVLALAAPPAQAQSSCGSNACQSEFTPCIWTNGLDQPACLCLEDGPPEVEESSCATNQNGQSCYCPLPEGGTSSSCNGYWRMLWNDCPTS